MPRLSESGAMSRYLDDIGRYPLMTGEEEVRLGNLVQQGRSLRDRKDPLTPDEKRLVRRAERAEKRFVEANLRLVVSLAKKYASRGLVFIEFLDLVQEGNVGLMRAVELFDPKRGYKFSTYAYWWIKQGMTRCIGQRERLLRLPTGISDKANRLGRLQQELRHELGRAPTKAELAEGLKMSMSEFELMLDRSTNILSLDAKFGGTEDLYLADSIADPASIDADDDWRLDYERHRSLMPACLDKLTEKERMALERRYGLDGKAPATYADIAKDLGVTRERVRQICAQAAMKLRLYLNSARLGDSRIDAEEAEEATAPEPVPVAPAPKARGRLVPEALPMEARREQWQSPARRHSQRLCELSTVA